MDSAELNTALQGRFPVAIALEDVPRKGEITTFSINARPITAVVHLFDCDTPVVMLGALLTKEQALGFAVTLMEMVAKVDPE